MLLRQHNPREIDDVGKAIDDVVDNEKEHVLHFGVGFFLLVVVDDG